MKYGFRGKLETGAPKTAIKPANISRGKGKGCRKECSMHYWHASQKGEGCGPYFLWMLRAEVF